MKTFREKSQSIEAFIINNEQNYSKGLAMVDYAYLLAELFEYFHHELNYKDIVAKLPKVCIDFNTNVISRRNYQKN